MANLMSVPDFVMEKYMRLVTRWSPKEIDIALDEVKSGKVHPAGRKNETGPRDRQHFLWRRRGGSAEQAFVRVFQQKDIPDEMPEFTLKPGATVTEVLIESGLATSKSEAKRLLAQMGVRLDGEPLERSDMPFPHPGVLQAGKRRFVRVK